MMGSFGGVRRLLCVWPDFIMEHNRRGNSTVTLAHNGFSHLTLNEFHQRMGLGACPQS